MKERATLKYDLLLGFLKLGLIFDRVMIHKLIFQSMCVSEFEMFLGSMIADRMRSLEKSHILVAWLFVVPINYHV